MKVIHLISGGDSGGAKTHVHSLLQNLTRTIDVTMVCFMEGPFAQEARELGIRTVVLPGRNLLRTYHTLKRMIQEEGYEIIHCHGARGNMMGALLRRATGLPVVTTVHSDYRLDYLGRPFSRLSYGTINTIALRLLDYRIGRSLALLEEGVATVAEVASQVGFSNPAYFSKVFRARMGRSPREYQKQGAAVGPEGGDAL